MLFTLIFHDQVEEIQRIKQWLLIFSIMHVPRIQNIMADSVIHGARVQPSHFFIDFESFVWLAEF